MNNNEVPDDDMHQNQEVTSKKTMCLNKSYDFGTIIDNKYDINDIMERIKIADVGRDTEISRGTEIVTNMTRDSVERISTFKEKENIDDPLADQQLLG